jgi:membrane protein
MRILSVARRAIHAFSADECSTRAAALAYYAFFSLPPVLLIIIYVAGLRYGEAAAAGQISSQLESFVGPQVGRQIESLISNAAQQKNGGLIASLFALAGLIYASTTAFAELQHTLNRAWSVEPNDWSLSTLAKKRFVSFLMVIAGGLVLVASMVFGTVVSRFGDALPFQISGRLPYVVELLVPWVVISILVAVVFKMLPDARVRWRDVAVGAIVSGTLLVLAKYGMTIYLSRASVASGYGAAGSLAILLLWLYVSAAFVLIGAEFTRAWAQEHGRDVQPTRDAHRIRADWRRAA